MTESATRNTTNADPQAAGNPISDAILIRLSAEQPADGNEDEEVKAKPPCQSHGDDKC